MAIVPVRGFSKYGVLTDPDPYSLPPEAFSMAVNARFQAGSVLRAPVFRNVTNLTTSSPRYVAADNPNSGFSKIIVGYLDGSVASVVSGTETDISIDSYTGTDNEGNFTSTRLADVFYVNRPDRIPWALTSSATAFVELENWTSTWRAQIIRSAGGALCAFGITKDGTFYPTMVKTSEFAIAGTVPSTWDETDETSNATENILAEMISPITDAAPLGEMMMVYGLKEAWTMVADGSENVWSYRKLYGDKGSISANCSIEVDGRHYVFGLDDLWVHDGVSPHVSIADDRVRDFVFNSIDMSKTNRCHVGYNSRLKEVSFNFVSNDAFTGFLPNKGCNRSAVYNIVENVWTFYDLPQTFASCEASVNTVVTWDTVGGTWETIGGTWADLQDSNKRVVVMVGDDDTGNSLTRSLYAVDLHGPGSVVNLPVDQNATKGVLLQRDGIDLSTLGVDLKGYKVISSVYPQGRLEENAEPLTFNFGSADYFNQVPQMGTEQTYDGATLYKLDYNIAGRYLFMKMTHNDFHYFNLTALDLDLDVLGER